MHSEASCCKNERGKIRLIFKTILLDLWTVKMKIKKWLYPLLITGLIFSSVSESLAAKWGTIIYPAYDTNIRAKRSVNSKLKGLIKTGQPVKVDFLVNDWYAAFKVTEKQRNESKALGYVYAPSLHRSVCPSMLLRYSCWYCCCNGSKRSFRKR